MQNSTSLRLTFVHDWLTGMRGGEKCLQLLAQRWPTSKLYTLLHSPGKVDPAIEGLNITTSPLQKFPGVDRYYRNLLPLMPPAIEHFRLSRSDLVLSLSHCVAKSIRIPQGVPHICYCFTPMRYAWHMRDAYFGETSIPGSITTAIPGSAWDRSARETLPRRTALNAFLTLLRHWDKKTAARVTHFIAISRAVQSRILDCYNRDSTVIYPPVDTEFYTPARVRREDYYLVVSAFAPYKKVELTIRACNILKKHLLIIGNGQDEARLKSLAGPTVQFTGWQPNEIIRNHYRRCKALLFPGEEEFGIVPVEANACGTPVIAFEQGGATETLIGTDGTAQPTAHFFAEQSADCLADAIYQFESNVSNFSSDACVRQARKFNAHRFIHEMEDFLYRTVSSRSERLPIAA